MSEQPPFFGEELRRVREAKGWTLREAARHLGVSFSRLGTWERGIDSNTRLPVLPPYKTVKLMAAVLKAPQLLAAAGYPIEGDGDDEKELLDGYRRLGEADRDRLMRALRTLLVNSPPVDQGAESASQPGSSPGPTDGATRGPG